MVTKRVYEHKTTEGLTSGRKIDGEYIGTSDPEEPDGDGWELVGSAADAGGLYWFWRRPTPGAQEAHEELFMGFKEARQWAQQGCSIKDQDDFVWYWDLSRRCLVNADGESLVEAVTPRTLEAIMAGGWQVHPSRGWSGEIEATEVEEK